MTGVERPNDTTQSEPVTPRRTIRLVASSLVTVMIAVLVAVAAPLGTPAVAAQLVCEPSMTVATAEELTNAIECYAAAATGETVEVILTADVQAALWIRNTATPPAILELNGNGHSIGAFYASAFSQSSGDVRLDNITIADTLGKPGCCPGIGYTLDSGNVVMTRTTIRDNDGGISLQGRGTTTLTLIDSTVHSNWQGGIGASSLTADDSLQIVRSTITNNGGPGIYSPAVEVMTITGSLIAGNNQGGSAGQCNADSGFTPQGSDGGGNAVSDASCTGIATPGLTGSYVETVATNGCTPAGLCTPTIALLPGSPAIDVNTSCGPGLSDQRGVRRNASKCDAGAFELGDLCNGVMVTIDMNTNGGNGEGGPGNDTIMGTPGDDVINGGGGDDTICSGNGDDVIDAGAGDDSVLSGNGNDTIMAGDGDDWVRAGAGDDLIDGGAGRDRLSGVAGADTIHGGDDDDTIHGNLGDDILHGDAGNDRIFGYADNDTIYGGEGNDRLHGNFGEDTIWGEAGDDVLIGYGDNDVLHGGDGADKMHGNFGDDELNGGGGNDIIFGYGDDDTINGGPGADTINGNRGNDTLNGNEDDDQIKGADGDDVIDGGSGNDTLFGNSLNDTIDGGPGNDTIDGGTGTDTCTGGPDTDTTTRCEPNDL